MPKSYANCPNCGIDFMFEEEPQFDGSFLLTCPECGEWFSIIDGPPVDSDVILMFGDNVAQTAPVEDPNVVDEFLKADK